jgi:hypothetical protein
VEVSTAAGTADMSAVPLGGQILLGSFGAKENVGKELDSTVGSDNRSDLDTLGCIQRVVLIAEAFTIGSCVLTSRGMEVGTTMLLGSGVGSDQSKVERTGWWMEWVGISDQVAFALETCVLEVQLELETSLETGVGVQPGKKGAGTTVVSSISWVLIYGVPEC